MNRIILLILISLIISLETTAGEIEEDLSLGINAVKKNNQKKAFHYLYPLTKKGNTEAQYYLGALFIEAKNIKNHKEISKRFLLAASQKGHIKAAMLLSQLSIAEKSGNLNSRKQKILRRSLPTKEQLQYISNAEKKIGVHSKPATNKEFLVEIFVSEVSEKLNQIITDAEYINTRNPNRVHFSYYMKINSVSPYHMINAEKNQYLIPKEGFSPDINGQYIKKAGVTQLPSIILTYPSGKKEKINPSYFRSTLFNIL